MNEKLEEKYHKEDSEKTFEEPIRLFIPKWPLLFSFGVII